MAGALVVGGGVWGLVSAIALARAGLRVVLVEEHRLPGRPRHCTGLVSRRVVEWLGRPAAASVESWYWGFRLCGPSSCLLVEPEGGVYRLDRVGLEARLAEEAEAEGVRLVFGSRVSRVEASGRAEWDGGGGSFDLVVLAEGAHARLARRLGIGYSAPLLHGVNIVYDGGCGWDRGLFTVRFDPRARGFFAWAVPTPGGCVVGAGARDPRLLPSAVEALAPGGARRVGAYGGPLPVEGPARRLRAGRVVAVGDAAGLVKPLTGGGLYPAALYYKLASRALAEAGDPVGALEAAAGAVASRLRAALPAARLLRERPGLVDCIARHAGGRARGLDYDEHLRAGLSLAARPAAALGVAACDPAGAVLLAARALAGLASLALGRAARVKP